MIAFHDRFAFIIDKTTAIQILFANFAISIKQEADGVTVPPLDLDRIFRTGLAISGVILHRHRLDASPVPGLLSQLPTNQSPAAAPLCVFCPAGLAAGLPGSVRHFGTLPAPVDWSRGAVTRTAPHADHSAADRARAPFTPSAPRKVFGGGPCFAQICLESPVVVAPQTRTTITITVTVTLVNFATSGSPSAVFGPNPVQHQLAGTGCPNQTYH